MVVLPLVPVMPTTGISRLGCPATSAPSSASARRASRTSIHGTVTPAGRGSSETTSAAPRATAWVTKSLPSALSPFTATNPAPAFTRRESYSTAVTTAAAPAVADVCTTRSPRAAAAVSVVTAPP